MDTIDHISPSLLRISIEYRMPVDDVESIFGHYWGKGMTKTKALYYTQLAVAGMTGQSVI